MGQISHKLRGSVQELQSGRASIDGAISAYHTVPQAVTGRKDREFLTFADERLGRLSAEERQALGDWLVVHLKEVAARIEGDDDWPDGVEGEFLEKSWIDPIAREAEERLEAALRRNTVSRVPERRPDLPRSHQVIAPARARARGSFGLWGAPLAFLLLALIGLTVAWMFSPWGQLQIPTWLRPERSSEDAPQVSEDAPQTPEVSESFAALRALAEAANVNVDDVKNLDETRLINLLYKWMERRFEVCDADGTTATSLTLDQKRRALVEMLDSLTPNGKSPLTAENGAVDWELVKERIDSHAVPRILKGLSPEADARQSGVSWRFAVVEELDDRGQPLTQGKFQEAVQGLDPLKLRRVLRAWKRLPMEPNDRSANSDSGPASESSKRLNIEPQFWTAEDVELLNTMLNDLMDHDNKKLEEAANRVRAEGTVIHLLEEIKERYGGGPHGMFKVSADSKLRDPTFEQVQFFEEVNRSLTDAEVSSEP